MQEGYDKKRVHRVNYFATIGITAFFLIQILISRGSSEFFKILLYALPIVILASIVFFLKIGDNLKGFLFAFIPTVTILTLFIIDGYALNKNYMIFIPIAMIALYFEKKLILFHGICLNILFFIVYSLNSANFLGPKNSLSELITLLILLNGTLICFYFLNSWGKDLVIQAEKKEEEVKNLLGELTKTLEKIKTSTITMDENMASITSNATDTSDSSALVVKNFQEISTGSQEQAHSVNDINERVISISRDINETHDISEKITQ